LKRAFFLFLWQNPAPHIFQAEAEVRKAGLILLAAFSALAGCHAPGVRGTGNVISEPRTVGGFTAVKLKGNGQLLIDENGTESLVITADENLLPYITTEVSGSQLIIGTKDDVNINPSKDIVYKLSAKNLNSIELGGSGTVEAKGIQTDRMKLVLGGSGTISAAGTADEQEILIAGSGGYEGGNLKGKDVSINIMGSGDALLAASQKLDATIMGSGSIKYIGDPTVTQHILGSGSVGKQ
jgi:hypothetical protein